MAQRVRLVLGDGLSIGRLYLKGMLPDEWFTISRNWLRWERQSFQGQQGPRFQGIRIEKIKDMVHPRGSHTGPD